MHALKILRGKDCLLQSYMRLPELPWLLGFCMLHHHGLDS